MSRYTSPTMQALQKKLRSSTNGKTAQASPAPPEAERGATNDPNISSSDYARKCRELMRLSRDLRTMGADTLFDLPRITVIGGQSAGKSSLVEAVSGINVPRDSGTCTRCPMEFTMSSSAKTWSCDIFLVFEYDANGNRKPQDRQKFGHSITDKKAVDIWLRRAQAAILSPHLSIDNFINKTSEALKMMRTDAEMLKFSKNTIHVNIMDPDATDLSFVDLPGLIQNESPDVIELVRTLVVSHIKGANTLILITIPMSDDMENQQAVLLAREVDPEGERTIGVLTKPDTLTRGATSARQKWKDVIQGKIHVLKHGYYCVRLPDDDERLRGITRAESQTLAAEFFNTNPPWNEIADRHRFGIPGFVSDISRLLVQLIENNLPTLKRDVNKLLGECNDELDKLPVPVANEPSAEILLRITKFCQAFHSAVFGDDHKSLVQTNRRRYDLFKRNIRQTAPDFRPFVGHSQYVPPSYVEEDTALPLTSKPLDLLDVRAVIQSSIAWELPGHVPFDATKTLILQFTSCWQDPSIACFNEVFLNTEAFVDNLMTSHFGRFKRLESHIRTLTHIELNCCKEATVRTLEKMLQFENVPLFTQNTHYFESGKKRWLLRYDFVRQRTSRYLTNAAYPVVVPYNGSEGSERFQVDEHHDELAVMANVRAYFHVAYKRIIDYVPLAIEHELIQNLATKLQESLFQSLLKVPDAAEKMKELLDDDPVIANRRESLELRRARLMEIKERLENFVLVSVVQSWSGQ